MPELPEVETTKASLAPLLGQTVQQVSIYQPSLRWSIPHDLQRLEGQTLQFLNRRAKYIVARFNDDALLMHLGMSGSFALLPAADPRRKHDHLCIDFDRIQLRYHDPRRFGSILWLHEPRAQSLLALLGPEPLSDEFNADYLAQRLHRKQTAIKVAIMDNPIWLMGFTLVIDGTGGDRTISAVFRESPLYPGRPMFVETRPWLGYGYAETLDHFPLTISVFPSPSGAALGAFAACWFGARRRRA